jgi:hypothetical protein
MMPPVQLEESEMNLAQLIGWQSRLKRELSIAYANRPCNSGLIERIVGDMAIAEQCNLELHSDHLLKIHTRRRAVCIEPKSLERVRDGILR